MKITLALGLLAILVFTGCVAQTQPSVTSSIEDTIPCPCGCELNLRDCETYDPTCQTRAVVQNQIGRLEKEGKSPQEIITYFEQPELPSTQEILTAIATEQKSGYTVILYFYSETCSTCIEVKPLIKDVEKRFPHITLLHIEKRHHSTIFSQYGIETYPQLMVLLDGEEIRKEFSKNDDIITFLEEILS